MDLVSELKLIARALETARLVYAVCGGVAVTIHGAVRSTRDIDLVIRREDRGAVMAAIAPLGYVLAAAPMVFGQGTPVEREVQRVSKSVGGDVLTVDLLLADVLAEQTLSPSSVARRLEELRALDKLARSLRRARFSNESTVTNLILRPLSEGDSLAELTALLHRAYKRHADAGLRFHATWQDVATTRKRIGSGECHVAELDGRIVGTVTVYGPGRKHDCSFYDRPGIASFAQFAVDPTVQRLGIGALLEGLAERRAREMGATEMVTDTAEPALELIARYERRGYRRIGTTQWSVTNYRSVVLSKPLGSPEGPA